MKSFYVVQQYIEGQWINLFQSSNLEEAKSFAIKCRTNREIITIDLWQDGEFVQTDIPF